MDAVTRHNQDETKGSEEIIQRAYSILDTHAHFRGRAARFEFVCKANTLVVRGAVPTFYLKQVLQSVLRDVEGVRKIENQVQVVSAAGLSSVGKR